jgi:hypothetical protein
MIRATRWGASAVTTVPGGDRSPGQWWTAWPTSRTLVSQ